MILSLDRDLGKIFKPWLVRPSLQVHCRTHDLGPGYGSILWSTSVVAFEI